MIRVFCDFDGTVALQDVGNQLFRRFAGDTAVGIVQRYLTGEINARECLTRECEAINSLTSGEIQTFLEDFDLDPLFPGFVRFCGEKEIPLAILSDGLDIYVRLILERHGLGHLAFFANHGEFVPQGVSTRLVPSFPYRDEHCDRCGNCKRNHIATMSADEDVVVYVGDGISDRCPVRYADIVFAKHDLIRYCQEENISYFEFRNFGDVQERLAGILQRKRVKQRREAAVARRDLFIAE